MIRRCRGVACIAAILMATGGYAAAESQLPAPPMTFAGGPSDAAAFPVSNKRAPTLERLEADIRAGQRATTPALLKELLSLREGDGLGAATDSPGLENLRIRAMADEAHRLGSQAALHWRYKIILSIIRKYERSLDEAFNFGPLMIEEVVLPPVIKRIERASRKYSDREMRTVTVGYRLEHPARIVTIAPTWRAFLVRQYPMPDRPADVLLPKNGDEVEVWQRNVRLGWAEGLAQANRNFRISLNLLTSTYIGMLQYKMLLAQNVVSAPNLATTNLRITSDGRTLNIGDRIYRLTSDSEFTDSARWDAVPIAPGRDPR